MLHDIPHPYFPTTKYLTVTVGVKDYNLNNRWASVSKTNVCNIYTIYMAANAGKR